MQSTEPKKSMTFWNMLNYSIWKRLCIKNEPIEILLEESADPDCPIRRERLKPELIVRQSA